MLRVVIFDFDGVIVDSEPLHFEIFQRVLSEEGVSLSLDAYQERYLAMDDKTLFYTVFVDSGKVPDLRIINRLIARKADLFEARMCDGVTVFPGVVKFIQNLAERLPVAIYSGALRPEIEMVLTSAGLRAYFRTIVSAEEVRNCKPHPEGYLLALSRLNKVVHPKIPFQPDECLVIEDSVHGVESALRAGMRCLAVTNSYPEAVLKHATRVVPTLDGITWHYLEQLFA